MTDAQVASQAIALRVKGYSDKANIDLTMLFGQIGNAKGPQDTVKIADGRSTVASKTGEEKIAAVESALKALSDWAVTTLKA